MNYPVNDVYLTIQGEGCQTGIPMVLVRLQGCDVGCAFCDTKETWSSDGKGMVAAPSPSLALGTNGLWASASDDDIVQAVRFACKGTTVRWVLLTGGEPATYDLAPLVRSLHRGGYNVAVETSGTELGHVGADLDWITVSPKIGMAGGKEVLPEAVNVANEVKYVVGKQDDITKLEDLVRCCNLRSDVTICLQPMSQSERATQLCLKVTKERGWRLSLQIHKYLNQR